MDGAARAGAGDQGEPRDGAGRAAGIGKDTILEPLRHAIGPWNFSEVTPVQMMGRFNGFLKAVVLRVNEVRDRGETDRYAFYNHSKIMIAAPPDTLPGG